MAYWTLGGLVEAVRKSREMIFVGDDYDEKSCRKGRIGLEVVVAGHCRF